MLRFKKHYRMVEQASKAASIKQKRADRMNKELAGLKVLKDSSGDKMGRRLFNTYVSAEDYSQYPAFITELDGLISKFGGQIQQPDDDESGGGYEEEEEEGEDQIAASRIKEKKVNKVKKLKKVKKEMSSASPVKSAFMSVVGDCGSEKLMGKVLLAYESGDQAALTKALSLFSNDLAKCMMDSGEDG